MAIGETLKGALERVTGKNPMDELKAFLVQNPEANDSNLAQVKSLLEKIPSVSKAEAINLVKETWKNADQAKISELLTEIEASNGFSLSRIESGISHPQAQSLFKIYKGLVGLHLKTGAEFASFSEDEKATLGVVGWRLVVDELSVTGFLKSAIQSSIPTVGSEDDILALGEKLLNTPDAPAGQTGTAEQTRTEILKNMKSAFDKVKVNILAISKLTPEQKKQIFADPNALITLIKTGVFKDGQWDIHLSENRIITPQLSQEESAGIKANFMKTLIEDTDSSLKSNERIGRVINVVEKVTKIKLEDLLKGIPWIGGFLAALVVGLKRILGINSTEENPNLIGVVDTSIKKSLEGLVKYASSEEGKKVKNIQFISSLTEDKGKDFFKFLKDTKVDIASENFWPLMLSGKLANGQDGTSVLSADTHLGKLQKFMNKTLEASTNPEECALKLAKIRESEEFKETKTLSDVITGVLQNAEKLPLEIDYNNIKTLVSIEENASGVTIKVGEKKYQLSDIFEHKTMSGSSIGGMGKITNLSIKQKGQFELSTSFQGSEKIVLKDNSVLVEIIKNLIELPASYTTNAKVPAGENGEYALDFKFTQVA